MNKPKPLVIALSDTHIGYGKRDDFSKRLLDFDEDMMTISNILGNHPDVLCVANGDIFDISRYGKEAITENKHILELLEYNRFILIPGNHAAELWQRDYKRLLPASIAHTMVERLIEYGIYICHGQEFDLVNGFYPLIGKKAVDISNFVGKISPRAEDWISTWGSKQMRVGHHSQENEIDHRAILFASRFDGVERIICGHTHRKVVTEATVDEVQIKYYNTGCWLNGDGFTVIYDDYSTNSVSFKEGEIE